MPSVPMFACRRRAWSVSTFLGPFAADSARKSAGRPGRDGWIRCTLPVESGAYGLSELLRLGDGIEVLGPRKLREQMIAAIMAMADRYGA